MTVNFDLIQKNDANAKAMGGTEITTRQIYDGAIPRELLEQFQIIPSRLNMAELDLKKIRVLHLHDLPEDPMYAELKDPNVRSKFHKFVFSSQWQYDRFQLVQGFGLDEKCVVIEPGIEKADVPWGDKLNRAHDRVEFAYTSTPQRGLQLLVSAFSKLAEEDPRVHLHVHSSFAIYGWSDADKQFEPLYEQIRKHPQMTYHGFTPHDELTAALLGYHVHAYPCTWLETSCRAITEAMSAGVACVHPNIGALPHTGGGLNFMYQAVADVGPAVGMHYTALKSMTAKWRDYGDELTEYLQFVKCYADQRFSIPKVQSQWRDTLSDLSMKYPTPESRGFALPMFTYRS